MINNPQKSYSILFLITIAILAIIILVVTIILPSLAVKEFGNPSNSLSISQEIILPLKLLLGRNELHRSNSLSGTEVLFEINLDESASTVCLKLEQAGLLIDSEVFKNYLIYKGYDRLIQSGVIRLTSPLTAIEIAELITEPVKRDITFVILPGWRIEEIAASLVTSGLNIEPEEFINLAYHPTFDLADKVGLSQESSLEGFLYPQEYQVPRNIVLIDFISLLLDEFNKNLDSDLMFGFESQDLTLSEAVTLASIIQREAIVDAEQPLIASVFYNRLNNGMRLETDPTVQYALGYNSLTSQWWKSPLSYSDLTSESAYNTYRIYGLPPGPICNPTISALRAVAYPADSPYFYFRAACDNSRTHNFSITFDEHLGNECP
ncbi:MAG: endolytic transglycosylase MltG [Anaerolineaceae bacterium]|nr:endolytic transglycosylase MltG [Anaerolineaceae bacterium]